MGVKKLFVSYTSTNGIGFMCVSNYISKTWLKDRLFDKDLVILFISEFTNDGNVTLVAYMENGVYKNKTYNFILQDVNDVDKVWRDLKTDDNELHILSFKNITDEYEE